MSPTHWGWYSADEKVATVDNHFWAPGVSGWVQSIGEGTTTVTLRPTGPGSP